MENWCLLAVRSLLSINTTMYYVLNLERFANLKRLSGYKTQGELDGFNGGKYKHHLPLCLVKGVLYFHDEKKNPNLQAYIVYQKLHQVQ